MNSPAHLASSLHGQRWFRGKLSRLAAPVILSLACSILAACSAQPPTATAQRTSTTRPQPTLPSTPSPTSKVLPTEAPTAASTQLRLDPEKPAVSTDQIVGSWAFHFVGDDTGVLTFEQDGTYKSVITGGADAGMVLEIGTYHFEEDALVLTTDWCAGPSGVFTCTGKYRVFVAMADDKPGSLRFVLI